MTSNGHLPAFDLSRLSYGDLRRLQQLDPTTPEGQDMLDGILTRAVVGGLDAIPVTAITATVSGLMGAITEAMSGKGQPAAPSSTGSGVAELEVPST